MDKIEENAAIGMSLLSERARLELIMAAGELFIKHGKNDVRLLEIAAGHGESLEDVYCLFGGEDGLWDAVVEYAAQPWAADPFGEFARKNESLLSSRSGQELMIFMMVELLFKKMLDKSRPRWCMKLMARMLFGEAMPSQRITEAYRDSVIAAFVKLYARITGNYEQNAAFCWSMAIMAPAYMLADVQADKPFADENGSSIERNLMYMTAKNALFNAGLVDGMAPLPQLMD